MKKTKNTGYDFMDDFKKEKQAVLDALGEKTFKSSTEMKEYLEKKGTTITGFYLSKILMRIKEEGLITYENKNIKINEKGKIRSSSINYKTIKLISNENLSDHSEENKKVKKNEIKKIEKQKKMKKEEGEKIKISMNENSLFYYSIPSSELIQILESKIAEVSRMLSYISKVSDEKYIPEEEEFKNISQEYLKELNPEKDYTIELFKLLSNFEYTLIRDTEPFITKQDTGPQSYYKKN